MAIKLIVLRSALGAKIESTPYVKETLSDWDFDLPVKEVSLELSQENHEQKYSTRNMSVQEVVKGRQNVTVSFIVPLKTSGVAGVAPKEDKLLQACGYRKFTGVAGVVYTDDGSITAKPISLTFISEASTNDNHYGVAWEFRGCMGNSETRVNAVGEPVETAYEFQGAIHDIKDVSPGLMPSPTGMDTTIPLSTKGSNLKVGSYTMNANTFNFNQNNVVNVHPLFNANDGNDGAYRVDHNPGGTLDPYITTEAAALIRKTVTGETGSQVTSISYQVGDTGAPGNFVRLKVPRAQLLQSHSPSDRDGGYAHNIEWRGVYGGATGTAYQRIYGNPTGLPGFEASYGT